jgi:hypothetical protein
MTETKRTRRIGKAVTPVIPFRGEPYFETSEEVDSFLKVFPPNEDLDKDILKEIMIRAIRPNSILRNIKYTNSLKVINNDTGEPVIEQESAKIVSRLENWGHVPKEYPRSKKLLVKQSEELLHKNGNFTMKDIQRKAVVDNEPILVCCARNLRTTLNINVEITTPKSLLYCSDLSQLTTECDIVTCGRYISDFHVDAAGTLRMHLLLRGRKLIIIGTSRQEKFTDYYNAFKLTTMNYNDKLRMVLNDPQMWDIVIQDQRF